MSGEKDDTDDLIAELSKLMAADSRSEGSAQRQPSPAVEPRPVAAPGVVRIPGLAQAAPAVEAPRAPVETFDFSHASQSASTGAPAWTDRPGSRPPGGLDPFAGLTPRPSGDSSSDARAAWQQAPSTVEADAKAAADTSSFDFDFGFNRERAAPTPPPRPVPAPAPAAPAAGLGERSATHVTPRVAPVPVQAAPTATPHPAAAPVVQMPSAAAPAPQPAPMATPHPAPPSGAVHDPIADLIAAELGASVGQDRGALEAINAAAAEATPQRPTSFIGLRPSVPPPSLAPAAAAAPVSPAVRPIATENDRFTTAPVFGLGNRPAGEAAAPKAQLDPMDEIENLIGEAVRVELNTPAPAAPVRPVPAPVMRAPLATPVVPPLNSQFAPRRTPGLREPQVAEPQPTGFDDDDGDETIRRATGVDDGDLGANFADERPVRQPKQSRRALRAEQRRVAREEEAHDERPSGTAFKQLVVPAIAGVILVAGGFGLYWAMGMGHRDGKVPVFAADASPAKTVPPKPADSAPHSVVMDELAGNTAAPSKETLVSRDQTAGTDAMQVAAQSGSADAASPSGDSTDGGLANRKVRTVTVRPDGTIVSGDDTVAGAAQLPVDRPNVPTVPGMAVANTDATAPTPGSANALSLGDGAGVPTTGQGAEAPSAAGAPTTDQPASDTAATDANAPVPLPRLSRSDLTASADSSSSMTTGSTPSSPVNAVVRGGSAKPMDLIGNLVNQADSSSAPASTAEPQAAAPAATSAGGWAAHVQLASQQSEAAAQASAATLQRRFGSLWGDAKLQIVKVDLAKGTYYRVVLPADSLQSAQQTCVTIKAGGGDCVAGNG